MLTIIFVPTFLHSFTHAFVVSCRRLSMKAFFSSSASSHAPSATPSFTSRHAHRQPWARTQTTTHRNPCSVACSASYVLSSALAREQCRRSTDAAVAEIFLCVGSTAAITRPHRAAREITTDLARVLHTFNHTGHGKKSDARETRGGELVLLR